MTFRTTLRRLFPLLFAAMFVGSASAQNTFLIQNPLTGHFLSANVSAQPVMVSSSNCNSVQLCYWTWTNQNQLLLGSTSYALTYVDEDNSTSPNHNLFIQPVNGSDPNQIFDYVYNSTFNSYQLQNRNMTDKVMDLLAWRTSEYAPVGLFNVSQYGQDNQNFTMIPTSMGSSCSSTSDAVTSSDGQSITCVNNNVGSQYSSFQNSVVSTRTGYNVSCSAGYVVCGTQATYLLNNPPIANGILNRVLFGELDFQCCALPQSSAYNYETVQNTVVLPDSSLSFTCPNNGFLVGASTDSTSAQNITSFTYQCLEQQSVTPLTGYGVATSTICSQPTSYGQSSQNGASGYGSGNPIPGSGNQILGSGYGNQNNNQYLGNGNIANVFSGSDSVSAGALQFAVALTLLFSLFF